MKSKYLALLLVALVIVAVIFISGYVRQMSQEQPEKNLSFVYAQGTDFMIDGKPFHFVGAFAQNPITERLYSKLYSLTYKRAIDKYLESLPKNVNVIRIFAYGPYSKSQYNYDEPNWERLDYLVKSAEEHGVYIIWALYDYWDYGATGIMANYRYEFWNDKNAKQQMLKQVERYKDSPAIFGWELMNEGDAQTIWDETAWLQVTAWVEEVSKSIKAIDNKHLVSTGFSNENLRETYFSYPDVYQARRETLLKIYKLPTIDFITFHAYGGNPDLQTNASFFTEEWMNQMGWYLTEMTKIRDELGKPIVLEEFGTQRQVGEPVRKQVYDFVFDQAIKRNISCLFNTWADDNYPYSLSIYTYDEEYYAVKDAAERMKNIT